MNTSKIAESLRQLADELETTTFTATATLDPLGSIKGFLRDRNLEDFDRFAIFPPIKQQSVESLASLANYDNDAWFEDKTKGSVIQNRPKGAYILLYPSIVPQETKGKNPNELSKLFAKNGWLGLTLPEYLVLQRLEFEANGDHKFDAYDYNPEKSQWSWLLDSRIPQSGGSEYVVRADWVPDVRRVGVGWDYLGSASPRLGARPAVVCEL